jgi:putative membrane protein
VKAAVAVGVLVGLLLATILIGYFGFAAVLAAFLSAGWGMLALGLYRFVGIFLGGIGWWVLLRQHWHGRRFPFFYARWIRESVNSLLPVAQIGGDVAGARVIALHGAGAARGGASAVVAKTVDIVSQFVFALTGVALLLHLRSDSAAAWSVAIGLAVFAPLLLGFVAAQRMGMFNLVERFLLRLERKFTWVEVGNLKGLHETIMAIYRDRRAVFVSFLCHFAVWLTGAGEVWLALYFMGVEIGFAEAFVIESLAQAVRSAGFAIPASLGIQEGGYLVFGTLVGLGPEVALALSLVRRVRQILIGVPGLLLWQFVEGRRLADPQNRPPLSDK